MTLGFRLTKYVRPRRLEEAIRLLAEEPKTTRVIAGGTDLLVAKPPEVKCLVDIADLDLAQIDIRDDESLGTTDEIHGPLSHSRILRLGATVTIADLEESQALHSDPCWTILSEAAASLGTPGVRNRATIGGNLCNASPAADLAVAALALGAAVEVAGPRGRRTVAVEDFFLGPRQTALAPGEIVTAILVPAWKNSLGTDSGNERYGASFFKLCRHQCSVDVATVNVAVALSLSAGRISRARIALGGVAETPVLSQSAASALNGNKPASDIVAAAASLAVTDTRPIDDIRASANYRRAMTAVLVRRALTEALRRCQL